MSALNPRQFGPLYHGTTEDVADEIEREGFKPGTDESRGAIWLARDPSLAERYASARAEREGKRPAVLEVSDVRGVPSAYTSTRMARESGDDLSDYGVEVAVHNPAILKGVRRHRSS